jgi:hypothetical protein
MADLVLYDAMCQAIIVAHGVDEVKDIRDKALAIEVYSRQARNIENEKRAIEIRIRAERRCGELLAEGEKVRRGPDNSGQGSQRATSDARTLADLGISKGQSSRWQKLASVPAEEFEKTFAGPGKPSTGGIVAKHEPKKNVVDDNALWLWGRLLDFERLGLLDRDPNEVCAGNFRRGKRSDDRD